MPRSVKSEGTRCSRCPRADSPAARGEDHGGAGCSHAAHGGPHNAACGYALKKAAALGKPMLEQAPGRSRGQGVGDHAGASFLAEAAAHKGDTLEQSVPEGLYSMGRIHTEAVLKDYLPWKGPPHCSRGRA